MTGEKKVLNGNGFFVSWKAISVFLVILALIVLPLFARVGNLENFEAAQEEWNTGVKEDVTEIKRDVKDLLKHAGSDGG